MPLPSKVNRKPKDAASQRFSPSSQVKMIKIQQDRNGIPSFISPRDSNQRCHSSNGQ